MSEEYKLQDLPEINSSNPEGTESSKLEKFFDNDLIKANQEIIENVLNKDENKSLKEGFENFVLTEKNVLKVNAVKLKLSKTTDETIIKSIIAEVVKGGYKIGDEKIGNEKLRIEGNGKLEDNLQQTLQNEEEAVQKEEEAVQKEEEAVQKEEEAVQKEEEEGTDIEKTNQIMEEVKQYKDYLVNKYPELNKKVDENFQTVKKQLENNGTLNQLRQNHDEQFINDYILVQTTLQELKSNPTDYEQNDISYFDKIVKNLNNACNVPDTNLNSFSKDNIGDTRKEMFNADVGNNNLISARDSNKESHSAEYGELFKDTDMMDTIKKYGKFFPEGAKQYLKKYEEYYKSGKALEYENSDEGKNLKETLLNVKLSVDNYTENFIEEMCLMSQIKGMTMCMGKDFNINKAREINNENGVLTIEGHINGIDFGLRHDTNNPDSLLQTSSKFSASPDKGSFTIRSKPEFTDNANSNFILPSQTEVFNLVTQRVKTAMNEGGILDNAGNRDEFKNALENELQNDIIGKIDDSYKNTEYTHHYITDKVRSEQIVDNAVGLIKSINPSETNLPGEISITSNPKLFNFIKILSFNLENSTAEEKNKLDESITQIKKIIRENKNNNGDNTGKISSIPIAADSIAADYLKAEKRNASGNKETKNSQRDLISELFSQYSEHSQDARYAKNIGEGIPPKMIINDLYKDLFDSTSDVSQASKYKNDEDVSHNAYDNMMANRPNDSSDSDTSDMA